MLWQFSSESDYISRISLLGNHLREHQAAATQVERKLDETVAELEAWMRSEEGGGGDAQ